MQPLISVIVPVYNVEPYLDQCVESIVNQTYKNLEIILVDDGSPDNCPAMCDKWAEIDSRIIVIHKENGGLSDARNSGLKIATGEYIGFVDSDDWIHKDMFRLLLKNMNENEADISECGVICCYDDIKLNRNLTSDFSGTLTVESALVELINENKMKHIVCNKLYKKHIVFNLYFPPNRCHEDNFWTFRAVSNAKRVSVFSDILYNYRQRESSIMSSKYSLKRLDFLDARIEVLKYISNAHPQIKPVANLNLWFSCIYAYQMCMKHLDSDNLRIAKALILSKKSYCDVPKLNSVNNIKQKIWLLFSRISFIGACKFRNFFNIGF